MHDEARKLTEKLKAKFGDQIVVAATDDPQLAQVAADPATALMVLTIDRGNHAQARDAAKAANETVKANPMIRFLFAINGCVHDPRELDDIPDARATLCALFTALTRQAFHRFDIVHQSMMLVAMGYGVREGTQLNIPEHMVRR